MDTDKYRRKLEQGIAKAQTRQSRTVSTQGLDDRRLVGNRKAATKKRIEALGRVTRAEGLDGVPAAAIERLADPKEAPAVRLAAIRLLQQKQVFSPAAADWRPAFVDALRSAVDNRTLRHAALEVLSLLKDRPTQERLLAGVRNPKKALVPLDEALRLLSTDVHADVIDTARSLTKSPRVRTNKAALVEAVRLLAADQGSVGTLEKVLANDKNSIEARRVAATALSHLSPAPGDAAVVGEASLARGAAARSAAKPKGALATHLETLRRIRQ